MEEWLGSAEPSSVPVFHFLGTPHPPAVPNHTHMYKSTEYMHISAHRHVDTLTNEEMPHTNSSANSC